MDAALDLLPPESARACLMACDSASAAALEETSFNGSTTESEACISLDASLEETLSTPARKPLSTVSPGERRTALLITFLSSLILPGHL